MQFPQQAQQFQQNVPFQQYPQNQQFQQNMQFQQYPQNQQFQQNVQFQQYPQNQQFPQQYQQTPQMGYQQMNWQQQQAQNFQQNQQPQQKLPYYQQMIQGNPQQLLQILQMQNNFMEALQFFPILFSNIYKENPGLFQNIKNIYPQQINQLMANYPSLFPQGQVQTNNNSEIKELIPRNAQNFTANEALDPNQNIVNITFKVSTGHQANMAVNGNITIEQLIKKYVQKLNLPENVIGKDIMFIYNGQQLNPKLKDDINSTMPNGGLISVYDVNNIIGA